MNNIVLNFLTNHGGNRAVRVNNANPALTRNAIFEAMSDIIDSTALLNDAGRPISARSAVLSRVVVKPIVGV